MKELGGYAAIDYDDPMPSRAHFLKLYEALYTREISRAVQLPQVTAFIDAKRLEANQNLLEA